MLVEHGAGRSLTGVLAVFLARSPPTPRSPRRGASPPTVWPLRYNPSAPSLVSARPGRTPMVSPGRTPARGVSWSPRLTVSCRSLGSGVTGSSWRQSLGVNYSGQARHSTSDLLDQMNGCALDSVYTILIQVAGRGGPPLCVHSSPPSPSTTPPGTPPPSDCWQTPPLHTGVSRC